MINKILYFLFLSSMSWFYAYASMPGHFGPGIKINNITGKGSSRLKGQGNDTFAYKLPMITIHAGASMAFTRGNIQLNSTGSTGGKQDFQDQLGFPSSTLFPRINVFFRFGNQLQFIFDLYYLANRETHVISQPVQYGHLSLDANTRIRTTFNLWVGNAAYRNSFLRKKHYDVGAVIGLSVQNYQLKIRQEESGASDKASFFLWTPLIGLDAYGFLNKDFYIRSTLGFFTSPIHNYDFTFFSFKPYLEYYIWRNLGLGVRYHYSYANIRELPERKFNGNLKYQFHAVSLVVVFRFFKKS